MAAWGKDTKVFSSVSVYNALSLMWSKLLFKNLKYISYVLYNKRLLYKVLIKVRVIRVYES